MNRYLAIPLCLSVVGFVAVLTSRTSLGDPAPDYAPAAYRPATGATPMLSYDQTRTFVLDQWPIASRNLIGSRAMPRSSFHATLERMASTELNVGDADDATSFLCTLRIDAEVFPDW
ncbi:MAG: hypothetical protein HKN47_03960, partial [Pirellulaceae bacterium]|nr:hypothetical protein [Pirellulaceae bacterium]